MLSRNSNARLDLASSPSARFGLTVAHMSWPHAVKVQRAARKSGALAADLSNY